ncbi:unnamed protein product [Gemmata massiliana]|uniref:Uncharacterized protein n=1 Tax=Gemmata massiliana TaxID=1210884 RepID=A0A6P2CXL3_9BACT|nr:hypothetical protein [Gemmata massiliana]VTR92514.1 unnamed protein product [Gemmata massiliana]
MSLDKRIKKLGERTHRKSVAARFDERAAAEWAAQVEAFLVYIPADLRDAIRVRLESDDYEIAEGAADWLFSPAARWALPFPKGYQFPRAMVEWIATAPAEFNCGNCCEGCGLRVPRLWEWGKAAPDRSAFPVCPQCGGKPTYEAYYAKGPKPVPEEPRS